tara:strand:+ start:139 stop:474 length:336 start_codon:yes stop_codon:yes gene_type:complete
MTRPNVLAYLAAPDRECSLRAVSLAVVKVRATGATYKEIAQAIDCCADTVAAAANETTLIGADAIFRLCYFWPAETESIRSLLIPVSEAPTMDDRIARIERELAAIRQEAA